MSSFRNETITCPSCNHEAPFRVWDSVNVTLDPDMKEQFLSGQLFHWTCPECGQKRILIVTFFFLLVCCIFVACLGGWDGYLKFAHNHFFLFWILKIIAGGTYLLLIADKL